jgi:hypothetical protein
MKEIKTFFGDSLKNELIKTNKKIKDLIDMYEGENLVFDFGPEEWDKISSQNFPDLKGGFMEVFEKGINIGNCGGTVKRFSYSYDNVDIVIGELPILKGTVGSPEGGHVWLEDNQYIYDTSLLLKIDKRIKDEFGYKDKVILTWDMLMSDPLYSARREYVNDKSIK